MIQDFYTELVNKIYEEATEEYLTEIIKIFKECYREFDLETLMKYKPFIILNDEYLIKLTGGEILNEEYDLYQGDRFKFINKLIIPLWGFDDKVHGFVGYDNGNDTPENKVNIKYKYQKKHVFKKEREIFITTEEYEKAFKDQYICIVDGIFDKIALTSLGIPSCSLHGTSLTKYHIEYLKFIKNWVVFGDNDDAGLELYLKCKAVNKNTVRITFNGAKDIDEKIKHNGDLKLIEVVNKLKEEGFRLNYDLDNGLYKKSNMFLSLQKVM